MLVAPGCGGGSTPAAADDPRIEAVARLMVRSVAPVARDVIAGCRTGSIGCAATDQEHWLTERSGGSSTLVFRRSDIDRGGRVFVLAPRTTGRQFLFAVRIGPETVLTGRVRERGSVRFARVRG